MTHVFNPNEEPDLVLQKMSQVHLYRVTIGKPALNEEEEFSHLATLVQETVLLSCIMEEKIAAIAGDVHSAMTLNIDEHLFLVDNANFYLVHLETGATKIFKDQNCVGLCVVDKKFCYTMSHKSSENSSGLRLYDIGNILTKDTDVSYLLSNV